MFHAVIMLIATCFGCTLYYFYAFSGTNLLTRCQSVSSVFPAVFGFRKSYTENIVEIGGNLFLRKYKIGKLPESEDHLRLYIPLDAKTLIRKTIFHEKFRRGRHRQSQIGGVLTFFPAPCRRGNHHRGLLHHHACLRSDA